MVRVTAPTVLQACMTEEACTRIRQVHRLVSELERTSCGLQAKAAFGDVVESAVKGASAGAAIGSAVPGVGTAVGTAVGAAAGGVADVLGGVLKGDKKAPSKKR